MKALIKGLLTLMLLVVSAGSYAVGLKTGSIAPDFSLPGLDGKQYSLKQMTARGHVFLVFWATECVYCYAHIKDYNRITEEYRNKLTVAAINIAGEYEKEVREYVKDNQLKYRVLYDRLKNLDVSEAYAVIGTPTMVLVSPEGKVLYYGFNMPDLKKWLN